MRVMFLKQNLNKQNWLSGEVLLSLAASAEIAKEFKSPATDRKEEAVLHQVNRNPTSGWASEDSSVQYRQLA